MLDAGYSMLGARWWEERGQNEYQSIGRSGGTASGEQVPSGIRGEEIRIGGDR